jgi:hypothetical protein
MNESKKKVWEGLVGISGTIIQKGTKMGDETGESDVYDVRNEAV